MQLKQVNTKGYCVVYQTFMDIYSFNVNFISALEDMST